MTATTDVAVVGGGQAGLAAARACTRRGLSTIVLEAGAAPSGAWPHYYDSLTLFSPAGYSSLPGLSFPGDRSRYPNRDEVVDYLHRYAARLDVEICTGHRVTSARREGELYVLDSEGRPEVTAHALICATGTYGRPHVPEVRGLEQFTGDVQHASSYRRPGPYVGKRVAVVGAGNSAVQIAAELSEGAEVILLSRRPVAYLPKRVLGRPVHFWHRALGLDVLPLSTGPAPRGPRVVDDGSYRRALAADEPRWRPLPATSHGPVMYWPDGASERIDSAILATGYRPHCHWMRPLQVLDPSGFPVHVQGTARSDPRVAWVGLPGLRTRTSGMIRGVGRDAEVVVARIARELGVRSRWRGRRRWG